MLAKRCLQAELALVSHHSVHALQSQDGADAIFLPRASRFGVLEQEVAASCDLVSEDLRDEAQVDHGLRALTSHPLRYLRAVPELVQPCPRAEGLALGARAHGHGPLGLQ